MITLYRFRPDGIYLEDVQYEDMPSPKPRGLSIHSPHPIPDGHFAIRLGGEWRYIAGSPPPWRPDDGGPGPSLGDAKLDVRRQVDSIRDQKIADGVPYLFPGDTPGTVQTRDLTDHRNIQANASAAQMYLIDSQPTAEMQFRDQEDVVHTLTATEMVTMCAYVMGYGQAIYSASWVHKDAIDALETLEAVLAYDVTTGWPV
jgi:hypothetical protein